LNSQFVNKREELVKQTFREDSGEYVIRTIDSCWLQTMRLRHDRSQQVIRHTDQANICQTPLNTDHTDHNPHTDHSVFINIMFYTMKSFNLQHSLFFLHVLHTHFGTDFQHFNWRYFNSSKKI